MLARRFWNRLTHSSRIMLIAYPVFSVGIALAYGLGDSSRTNTPSFDTAKALMPIAAYAGFFALEALIQVIGWVKGDMRVMIVGLAVGMGFDLGWAAHFTIALFRTPDASLTAPQVWLFIAVCHLASLQSITKDS